MTEKAARRISYYVLEQGVIGEQKRELLEYGIFHILSSILHILMLTVAGLLCSVPLQIAIYTLFFTALKRFIGGSHAAKHWICLWSFTLMALGGALLGTWLAAIGAFVLLPPLLGIGALALIAWRAPVLHPNSPRYGADKLARFRRIALAISALQLAAVCICAPFGGSLYTLALCGSLGSLSASITLLLPIPNPTGRGGDNNG